MLTLSNTCPQLLTIPKFVNNDSHHRRNIQTFNDLLLQHVLCAGPGRARQEVYSNKINTNTGLYVYSPPDKEFTRNFQTSSGLALGWQLPAVGRWPPPPQPRPGAPSSSRRRAARARRATQQPPRPRPAPPRPRPACSTPCQCRAMCRTPPTTSSGGHPTTSYQVTRFASTVEQN